MYFLHSIFPSYLVVTVLDTVEDNEVVSDVEADEVAVVEADDDAVELMLLVAETNTEDVADVDPVDVCVELGLVMSQPMKVPSTNPVTAALSRAAVKAQFWLSKM